MLARRTVGTLRQALSRRFSTTSKQFSEEWTKPSDVFPFDIRKKVRFTVIYTIFMTTGLGYPFLMVYYQSSK